MSIIVPLVRGEVEIDMMALGRQKTLKKKTEVSINEHTRLNYQPAHYNKYGLIR